MTLRIEAELTIPPSSVTAFRDVTLYIKMLRGFDILLECQEGTRSIFWKWVKDHGAHDFIDQLILPHEETHAPRMGRRDANIRVDRLTVESIPFAMSSIMSL